MSHLKIVIGIVFLLSVSACGEDRASQRAGDAPAEKGVDHAAPYAVGSSTRFIHDESRVYDSVAGIDSGIRTLITETWYPVEHATVDKRSTHRRATYGDYVFGNRAMHRLMMTKTTFFHLTPETVRPGVSDTDIEAAIDELFHRERNSYVDAPLAAGHDRLPVIVMSHGDAGSRYNMESACEHLAAHGYAVIAPEHTGNSPYSMTGEDPLLAADGGDAGFRAKMAAVLPLLNEHGAYGSEENYGQSYTPLSEGLEPAEFLRQLDRSLIQRLNDLRATLHELDAMNLDGPFAGRLDLDRIGLMGRSFGGTTTLMGLGLEDRFSAGIAVVPAGWADARASLPASELMPPGQESVLLASDSPFSLTTITKPTLLLHGAEDGLIIGLGKQVATSSGGPAPSPENPHPLLRAAFEATDAPVVWGLLADSNHASFGVSGGYWWPELKPDSQARVFSPNEQLKLIAPEAAHRIQKELALAFFDVTIRQDTAARDVLLNSRYVAEGLQLDFRNF